MQKKHYEKEGLNLATKTQNINLYKTYQANIRIASQNKRQQIFSDSNHIERYNSMKVTLQNGLTTTKRISRKVNFVHFFLVKDATK